MFYSVNNYSNGIIDLTKLGELFKNEKKTNSPAWRRFNTIEKPNYQQGKTEIYINSDTQKKKIFAFYDTIWGQN